MEFIAFEHGNLHSKDIITDFTAVPAWTFTEFEDSLS